MRQLITIIFLFATIAVFSQKNFQGRAVYMSKTTMDMSRFGNEMSEQRKKQILARMKNFLEKTYVLNFDKSSSYFKEEAKLAAPGTGGGGRWGGSVQGSIYKNTSDKKMVEATEFFGKKFLIKEEMNQPKWELGSETKQIGNYTCYKATLVKENNDFDWRSMRRPRNDEKKDSTKTKEEKKKKTVLVTAWYTPQIPVSAGPDEYWGLPGLILELNVGRTTMLCTEVVLNPTDKVEIKEPAKGKEVTREEYNAIIKQKAEEMRDRFRGRGRGGRRF